MAQGWDYKSEGTKVRSPLAGCGSSVLCVGWGDWFGGRRPTPMAADRHCRPSRFLIPSTEETQVITGNSGRRLKDLEECGAKAAPTNTRHPSPNETTRRANPPKQSSRTSRTTVPPHHHTTTPPHHPYPSLLLPPPSPSSSHSPSSFTTLPPPCSAHKSASCLWPPRPSPPLAAPQLAVSRPSAGLPPAKCPSRHWRDSYSNAVTAATMHNNADSQVARDGRSHGPLLPRHLVHLWCVARLRMLLPAVTNGQQMSLLSRFPRW